VEAASVAAPFADEALAGDDFGEVGGGGEAVEGDVAVAVLAAAAHELDDAPVAVLEGHLARGAVGSHDRYVDVAVPHQMPHHLCVAHPRRHMQARLAPPDHDVSMFFVFKKK
jgi:hypothetical protein